MIYRIAIIIAHPLATVVHADIVVMDQGRVVNVGNHKILLNRSTV
jgi:ABC-type multidrug transport system fused ATPase/permease subunit